jgi:hypothetical protein
MESRKVIALVLVVCVIFFFAATAAKANNTYNVKPTIDWSKCFSATYRPGETSTEACATIVARQTKSTPKPRR